MRPTPTRSSTSPTNLVFGLDDEPGIERRGQRRFRYLDQASGEVVDDPSTLARIRALAVPPAWTDVWIAADPCGHLQATGRDARGRKQYRYHDRFRTQRDGGPNSVSSSRSGGRSRSSEGGGEDLDRRGLPQRKVIALVVCLLEQTGVRVGNEEYARTNGSYGLTTLRNRHAHLEGSRLKIRFRAKSAKTHDLRHRRPSVGAARAPLSGPARPAPLPVPGRRRLGASRPVVRCERLPPRHHRRAWTAKTFRTWAATVLAAAGLGQIPAPTSAREGRHVVTGLMELIAQELDNTPAVCRRSYVHPAIVDQYLAGNFLEQWTTCSARGSPLLSADERRLTHLLPELPPACR